MKLSSKEYLTTLRQKIVSRNYRRNDLVEILSDYNRSIGNDQEALDNISRLKSADSVCVFTGQQLGFMGGPAYTLYKAISCLLTAKELQAVPVFWLATEDHDIAEIDHTYTVDERGNIQKHKISLPREGVAVEDLVLTEKNIEEIEAFYKETGISPIENEYVVGQPYADFMVRILVEMFRGTGLVFVEPRLIRPLASEIFMREVEDQKKIHQILQQTTQQLESQGLATPIEFREHSSNLFFTDEKKRRLKIQYDGHQFSAGETFFSKGQLLQEIQASPSRFSGNVAARPLIQSYVFPTLAYVGGPAEVAYYRQLDDYFVFHDVLMPGIHPRYSMTCVTPTCQNYLDIAKLQPSDRISHDWSDVFPELPSDNKKELKRILIERGVPYHALHYINNFLHPFNGLQERSINWLWLNAQSDDSIIHQLLKKALWVQQYHEFYTLKELTNE
jgi:bacillithiol synthase